MLKQEPRNQKFLIQVVSKNIVNGIDDGEIIEFEQEVQDGVLYDYLEVDDEKIIDGNTFLIKQDVDKITRDLSNDFLYRCSNRECKRKGVCFVTSVELDVHNSEVHLEQWREAQCPICNKSLVNRSKLNTHLELRHTPRLYTCDNCGKCFRSKDNLRLHMSHHRQYYKVECRACQRSYKSIQSLRYHLRQHFEHHQCEACGMIFEHKKLLVGHTAAKHRHDLQVQCRYCPRFFARPDVRDVHEREIHKNGTVKSHFKCNECEQGFDLREDLASHKILNHFSGVIHTCEECGKNFKKKSLLELHMHVHRKKSYQCDVCKMFFTFLTGLSKHKKLGRCKGPPDDVKNKLSKEDIARIAKEQLAEITVNPKKAEHEPDSEVEGKKLLKDKKSLPTRKKSPPPRRLPTRDQGDLPLSTKPAVVVRNLTSSEIAHQENDEHVITSSSGRIIKKKQPIYISPPRPTKTAKRNRPFVCDCCNLTFDSKSNLETHVKMMKTEEDFNCLTCDIIFLTPEDFKNHNAEVHQKKSAKRDKKFKCENCPKKYTTNHLLQMHKKSHDNLKEYKCGSDGCPYETNSPYDLNNHFKRVHNSTRPHECNICHKSFKRRCDLRNHSDTVHSEIKTYVRCPMCEAIVLEKGLQSHIINRHSEKANIKPYVCDICGKSERYEKNLLRHYNAVHEPKDRGIIYQCAECPAQFYRRREVTAHSFEHFQGTIHVCDTCGNKYKSKKELTNHEYTHRPVEFPCPVCEQVFQTKSGRGKHMKRHKMEGYDISSLEMTKRWKQEETVLAIVPDDANVEGEVIYEEYEMLDEAGYINIV